MQNIYNEVYTRVSEVKEATDGVVEVLGNMESLVDDLVSALDSFQQSDNLKDITKIINRGA